jgi:hypothetical protein
MVTAVQRQHSCEVSGLLEKLLLRRLETRKLFRNLMRTMIFDIAILLSQLGSLMIYNTTYTSSSKEKEMIRYCKSFRYGGQDALTNISIILTELVYL